MLAERSGRLIPNIHALHRRREDVAAEQSNTQDGTVDYRARWKKFKEWSNAADKAGMRRTRSGACSTMQDSSAPEARRGVVEMALAVDLSRL